MHYLIYKITNTINNRYYIGAHKTLNKDDEYMGSGTALNRAYVKYGKENFHKEIIAECHSEEDMYSLEKELVVPNKKDKSSYNIKEGGLGGWGYVNENGLNFPKTFNSRDDFNRSVTPFTEGHNLGTLGAKKRNELYPNLSSESAIRRNNSGEFGFRGKTHSEQTKKLMSGPRESSTAMKNSQYGTRWITNGIINKKIKKHDPLPSGWYNGRKIK